MPASPASSRSASIRCGMPASNTACCRSWLSTSSGASSASKLGRARAPDPANVDRRVGEVGDDRRLSVGVGAAGRASAISGQPLELDRPVRQPLDLLDEGDELRWGEIERVGEAQRHWAVKRCGRCGGPAGSYTYVPSMTNLVSSGTSSPSGNRNVSSPALSDHSTATHPGQATQRPSAS